MGASESDAWAQESYRYDVSQDGGIGSTPNESSEKQLQKVSCLKCGNIFHGRYGPRNLDRHVRSEHDGITFPCRECSRTYKRDDALLDHERKSHPNLQRSPKIPRKRSNDSQKGNISPSVVESNQNGHHDQISEPSGTQVRGEADHGIEGRTTQTTTFFL
jgi:Zn ribbon nucleic-acid-binding protein